MQFKGLIVTLLAIWCQYNFVGVEGICGVHARTVRNNEFTSIVGLTRYNMSMDTLEDVFCSGALVSHSHVLTSSICFDLVDNNVDLFKITFGSNDVRYIKSRRVVWTVTYNEWKRSADEYPIFDNNEIGIAKLSRKVHNVATPARILYEPPSDFYDVKCNIVGWGMVDNGDYPNYLITAPVTVLSKDDCTQKSFELSNEHQPLDDRYICSDNVPYSVVNFGDIGGPIMIDDNVIIGITLGLHPQSQLYSYHHKLNYHITLEHYRDFIETIAGH